MTGGHQIIKMRRSDRVTPEWAKSNKKIQQMLMRSFPQLRTNPIQRRRAARWATIIQLYYRMLMTRGQICAHTKMRPKVVCRLIENISLASKGMKANAKGPYSNRPPSRPKN
jgi:hypothetical protein